MGMSAIFGTIANGVLVTFVNGTHLYPALSMGDYATFTDIGEETNNYSTVGDYAVFLGNSVHGDWTAEWTSNAVCGDYCIFNPSNCTGYFTVGDYASFLGTKYHLRPAPMVRQTFQPSATTPVLTIAIMARSTIGNALT